MTLLPFLLIQPKAIADDFLDEFTELVNLSSMLLYGSQTYSRERIESYVLEAARYYRLDPYLLKAIIRVESNYDPYAISHKGAIGLMQLLPTTAKMMGAEDPWDPRQNILAGARYYRYLLNRLRGNHYLALVAYHCGPKAVETGNIPPESRRYARRVLRIWRQYKKQRRR